MSYDVDMVMDTGNGDYLKTESVNYTSNMWKFWEDYGIYFRELDGFTGKEALPVFQKAVTDIENTPRTVLEKYNASNGWGDWSGALKFIQSIKTMCFMHPLAKLRVSL